MTIDMEEMLPELRSIARSMAEKYPAKDDRQRAMDEALSTWRSSPARAKCIDEIERRYLQGIFNDIQHEINDAIRIANGAYGGAAKVDAAGSAFSQRCLDNILANYSICGKRLGSIYGSELPTLAHEEELRANTHAFNVRLCRTLAQKVDADRTVNQCVNEREVQNLFKKLGNKAGDSLGGAIRDDSHDTHAARKPKRRAVAAK